MSKWSFNEATYGFNASGIALISLRRSARGCLGMFETRIRKMKEVFSAPLVRKVLRRPGIARAKGRDERSSGCMTYDSSRRSVPLARSLRSSESDLSGSFGSKKSAFAVFDDGDFSLR